MSDFFVKDPIDCSEAELNKFLIVKGVQDAKGLRKSDKVRIAQAILRADNRNTIIFKAPRKGFVERGIFKARKWLSRNQQAEVPEVHDLINLNTPSAPSVVSSTGYLRPRNYLQPTSTHVNPPPRQNMPKFDPSPIPTDVSSDTANYAISYPDSDATFEMERVIPQRPAPVPRKSISRQTVSKIEPARVNHIRMDQESPIDQARNSPGQKTKQEISEVPPVRNVGNSVLTQDHSGHYFKDSNKYKFDLKFDTNSVSIEDYLKALNRWRIANRASDEKAINQGLQNFKNVSLANNIVETLSPEAHVDFETFYISLMDKLGKSKREWYQTFQRDVRHKNESAIEFFGKLCGHLKLGLGTNELTEAEQTQVTEKFLESVHPDLRGFLVIREPEVSFHDIAQVAQKIELARNIPRVKPASINNVMPAKPCEFKKAAPRPKPQNAQKNGPNKFFCTLCNKNGHSIEYCYGNAAGKRFDLAKFRAGQQADSKVAPALNRQ